MLKDYVMRSTEKLDDSEIKNDTTSNVACQTNKIPSINRDKKRFRRALNNSNMY